jgi:hypothetical protein
MTVRFDERARAEELVQRLLIRPEDVSDKTRPSVLVIEGEPGSGRSKFLDSLCSELRGKVPHALVNLGAFRTEPEELPLPRLLADIGFQLAEHVAEYESLRFNRLALGQVMMLAPLTLTDRALARGQARRMVRAHRGVDAVTAVIRDAAEGAAARLPAVVMPHGVLSRLVDAVVAALATGPLRSVVLGRTHEWFADPNQTARTSPTRISVTQSMDALTNLNRWHRSNDPKDRHKLNAILWKALLADLRQNFRTGRNSDEWSFNCVVMLDDVDTELGRDFIDMLLRMRWRGRHDPLGIVVTAPIGFCADLPGNSKRLIADDGAATPVSWTRYELPAPRKGPS